MPKMPKVKQAFIAFDSELHRGARQRVPTNSELFLDADERRFSGFTNEAIIIWTGIPSFHHPGFRLPPE
jgi:hypothetical protein